MLLTPTSPTGGFHQLRRRSAYDDNRIESTRFQIVHNSALSIDDDLSEVPRMNSIICTIGPKTQSVEKLKELIQAGMNIVRMNFSHGSYEFHGTTIQNAREAARQCNETIAIALDTKGPEIRTGKVKGGGEISIPAGKLLTVSTKPEHREQCDDSLIFVDYSNITKVVAPGGSVFIDDGLLNLEVLEVGDDFLKCRARNSAVISDHKGVNLPNANVDLPAVSEKDIADLQFGVEQGVDMIFASFIRKAADVEAVRLALGPKGRNIQIISKIENYEGVSNFAAIVHESDGIMVARGDLGIEIPPEKVFIAQKMMISNCNLAGKPVICATQMLESMTTNPRPTRAEVSDVANAVLDGADCVMLSGETAKGKYPIESVTIMAQICRQAYLGSLDRQIFDQIRAAQTGTLSIEEVVCSSAVGTAYSVEAPCIIVLTNTGNTARLVAKYRPRCPIYALTTSAQVARQLLLHRAVNPVIVEPAKDKRDFDARLHPGMETCKKDGTAKAGDRIVVVHADGTYSGHANLVRVVVMP
eukprot:TRINITY_DN5110_c0_g1_i1.p1 TRINITY_DN5110_c0_g1~~TRINITY_DN5110_c0_g1_i1.p1  ORF type:complete len:528 (-),score=82.02 TRINITY_DN5110_c0_g1_i1:27-1610(-)